MNEKLLLLGLIVCLIGIPLSFIWNNRREVEAVDYKDFMGFYKYHPNLKAQFLEVMKDKKVTRGEFYNIVQACNKDTEKSINKDSVKAVLFNLK